MPPSSSLYRRHRPRSFDEVVGQEHVVRTLRNAVTHGEVHHTYLFVGSRGTGKTSMAKILAACLNCERGGPTIAPCGVCDSCVSIASATSLDVIEMDAASNNSVDDIRGLRESVVYAPVSGRHKVYVLDEAHMLSTQAWNALLRTLEEPPANTVFVLATTEASKVLATIVDRCHRFDFARPTVEQLAGVIGRVARAEAIEIPDDAVALLARHAGGSFRDALGTLEQLVTYAGARVATGDVLAVLGVADTELLFGVLDAVAATDPRAALLTAAQVAATGRDAAGFTRDLEAHARDLMIVQTLGDVPPELRVTPDRDARLADQAARVESAAVGRLIDLLAEAMHAAKHGADARTRLELALVKATSPALSSSGRALLHRVERLEAAVAQHTPAVAAAPAAAELPRSAATPAAPSAARPARTGARAVAAAAAPERTPGAAVDAPLELAAFARAWPAVLDAVATANPLCAALLADTHPVAVDAMQLTVAFLAAADFARRKADDGEYRPHVAAAVRVITGHDVAIVYVRQAAAAPAPASAAVRTDEEWVRLFIDAFDAVEITPDPPSRPDSAAP